MPPTAPGASRGGRKAASPVSHSIQKVEHESSMTRNSQERRTPEQIRAGNKRIGLVMFAIAALFFIGIVVKQCWFS